MISPAVVSLLLLSVVAPAISSRHHHLGDDLDSFDSSLLRRKPSSILDTQSNYPTLVNDTFPLTLAVSPACGTNKEEGDMKEENSGIDLSAIRTIVAFGDSWTSDGSSGSIPSPPTLFPPSPSAGAKFSSLNRRASNGYMWVEQMAMDLGGPRVLNYAIGGAVIDNDAYNSTTTSPRSDFPSQSSVFFAQGKMLADLDSSSTLYTVAFGINDYGQFQIAGGDWDVAYNTYAKLLDDIQAAGGRNFLIHGMYTSQPETDNLQARVIAHLREAGNGTQYAFVNLQRLFSSIASAPSSFGYEGNATCLVSSDTIEGGCEVPEKAVFWIPGHPSAVTHKLISDYTIEVFDQCTNDSNFTTSG